MNAIRSGQLVSAPRAQLVRPVALILTQATRAESRLLTGDKQTRRAIHLLNASQHRQQHQ